MPPRFLVDEQWGIREGLYLSCAVPVFPALRNTSWQIAFCGFGLPNPSDSSWMHPFGWQTSWEYMVSRNRLLGTIVPPHLNGPCQTGERNEKSFSPAFLILGFCFPFLFFNTSQSF